MPSINRGRAPALVLLIAFAVTGCGVIHRTDRTTSRSAAFFADSRPPAVADIEVGPDDDLPRITVESAAVDGPGSLTDAIQRANDEGDPVRIEIRPELLPLELAIVTELPAVTTDGVRLNLAGVTLSSDESCRRRSGSLGCNGLVIEAAGVVVRGVRVEGFMFDGITVRGAAASDVLISECLARGNLDDGVGIADRAGPVRVERSVLVGNGFDPKGKGVLVFDQASAVLVDNVIVANRDGVTVSRGSRAHLERNVIAANFDKGLGARGATIGGRGNVLVGNGAGAFSEEVPNGDGLRVTLSSRVYLEDTVIESSGDGGVVVLDDAAVVLDGGRILRNRGVGVTVGGRAFIDLRGVDIHHNLGLDVYRFGDDARVLRTAPISSDAPRSAR